MKIRIWFVSGTMTHVAVEVEPAVLRRAMRIATALTVAVLASVLHVTGLLDVLMSLV